MSPARNAAARPPRALLFDGECGICTWFAGRAARIDRRGRYAILPYQDIGTDALARFGLSVEDCARRLHVLEPWPPPEAGDRASAPRAWGGATGLNVFLWPVFPWSLLVALVHALPPLLLLEHLAYRWVARHRAAISRRLGLRGCRVSS